MSSRHSSLRGEHGPVPRPARNEMRRTRSAPCPSAPVDGGAGEMQTRNRDQKWRSSQPHTSPAREFGRNGVMPQALLQDIFASAGLRRLESVPSPRSRIAKKRPIKCSRQLPGPVNDWPGDCVFVHIWPRKSRRIMTPSHDPACTPSLATDTLTLQRRRQLGVSAFVKT